MTKFREYRRLVVRFSIDLNLTPDWSDSFRHPHDDGRTPAAPLEFVVNRTRRLIASSCMRRSRAHVPQAPEASAESV